jgi:uncharacterized protein (TIGR00290 family)
MRGWEVECLVTVCVSGDDSMMFQLNGTAVAALQAASMGVPWLPVVSVGEEESEVLELETALRGQSDIQSAFFESWPQNWDEPEQLEILMDVPDLDALVVGALRSDYQKTRIDRMCERLGIISYSPLWHHGSSEHMHALVDHGFDARIASVSTEGLGEDWLGRRVDDVSLAELKALADKHRFNLDGEGGEFETIVLAAPHMNNRIECSAESLWDGTRGVWNIELAGLTPMR